MSRQRLVVVAIFRLKQLRKERGISQVRLSIDLNMGQNTISRYENEVHQADYKTLILFADYFDVSIDYLLGRTDNPKINK
jgi:transcriptional regulator with XRE-family HTH domain